MTTTKSKEVRVFKITDANKRVNKNFNSLKEAAEHVRKEKLYSASGTKRIRVEETVTREHWVPVEKPVLSEEVKQKLLALVDPEKLHYDGNGGVFNFGCMGGYFHWGKKKPTEMFSVMKELYGYSEEDLKLVFGRKQLHQHLADQESAWNKFYRRVYKPEEYKKIAALLLKKISPEKVKYTHISTDYTPCNAVVLNFDDVFTVQIRASDRVASLYIPYGRNVSLRKETVLDDETVEKFMKTTDHDF